MIQQFTFLLFVLIIFSCNTGGGGNNAASVDGTVPEPEVSVRFTGVKPYYVEGKLDKEVTFIRGVRNGMTKTYYASGGLKQVIIYDQGLRSDTAMWFYEDGKLYRTTPYVRDTIHGMQVQYYRSGRLKAHMSYNMGLRYPDLREYYDNGKMKVYNREIIIKTRDEYNERGIYKIFAELDNKSDVVVFYRGEFDNGLFNPDKLEKLTTSGGTGYLELSKSSAGNPGYAGIIAEYTTDFGNLNYIYKRVSIPYRDVN